MLQNARVTGFTISELLRGKTTKQRRGVKLLSSTQIRVLGNTDNPHVLFNEVKSTRSCKDMSVNFYPFWKYIVKPDETISKFN